MKTDLNLNIAGVKLKNPVVTASGTFGYGDEIKDLIPVSKLGAIITKTITLNAKEGNPPPRIAEVTGGILNTIGLQNVGVERFLDDKLPGLIKLGIPVIVSIAGETSNDYLEITKKLNKAKGIAAIELNLSCPNLKKKIICQDSSLVEEIIKKAVKVSSFPVIAKLSPSVADLAELSLLCEKKGAAALSLVNTFPGMAIDIKTWKPKLSMITGGLSGPAIKPLALRCVFEVFRRVNIPIIGGGGILTAEDAVEFMLAGASALSIGTANFIDPESPIKIIEGIKKYMVSMKIRSLKEIVGKLKI